MRHTRYDPEGQDDDRREEVDGRRARDHRPMWPMYIGTLISVATVVWGAAVSVANAAATADNVRDIKQQLNTMQAAIVQNQNATSVLNCRVGITCRTDGH